MFVCVVIRCSDLCVWISKYICCECLFRLKLILLAVANIAFETTEEQLRGVLSEVGPVLNLK